MKNITNKLRILALTLAFGTCMLYMGCTEDELLSCNCDSDVPYGVFGGGCYETASECEDAEGETCSRCD